MIVYSQFRFAEGPFPGEDNSLGLLCRYFQTVAAHLIVDGRQGRIYYLFKMSSCVCRDDESQVVGISYDWKGQD